MDNKWKNWLKKNFKRVVTLLLAAVIVVSFCLYHSDDRRLRAGRFSNNTRMTPGTQSEMEMDLPDYGSTEAAPLELVLDDQPAEEEASEEEFVEEEPEEEPAEEDVSPEEVDRQEEPEDSQGDYEDQIEEPAEEEEIIESAPEDEDISPAMDEEPVSAAAAEDAEKEQENESVDVPSDPGNTEESDRGGAVVYEQDAAGSGDGGASGGHSGPGVFTTEDGGSDAGTENVDENGQWDKTTAFFLQEDADGRENGEGLPQTFFTTEEDAETGLLADEGDPGKEMLDPKTFFTTEDSDSEDKEGVEAKEDGDGQDDDKAAEGRTGEAADAASEAGTGTLTASAANAGEKEAGAGSTAEKAGEAGTAGTAEAAAAAGTGSTAEAAEAEDENGIFFQGAAATLTFEGPDYIVTASYGEDAGIPEGAELVVSEITEDDDQEAFQNYSDQAVAAVVPGEGTDGSGQSGAGSSGPEKSGEKDNKKDNNKENSDKSAAKKDGQDQAGAVPDAVETESGVVRTVSSVRLFDIKIMAGGVEVEARGPVSVQIAYQESIVKEEGEEVSTVHFEGKKETPKVLDTQTETADTSPAENDQVSFETDGFSVFAVVVTKIEKIVLASDGHNYRISVTYGPETGIPENAQLEAAEILPAEEDSQDIQNDADASSVYGLSYGEYVANTEKALGMEEGSAGYIRLFDIKIVDQDDPSVKYQPAEGTAVEVRIELADSESEELSVVHFADETDSGSVVDAETEGQVVSFAADGFSVYAIVNGPGVIPIGWHKIESLDELVNHPEGLYIGHIDGYYFTSSTNTDSKGRTGIVKTTPTQSSPPTDRAALYYFEPAGEGQYYIYCKSGNTKKYVKNENNNSLQFGESESDKTAFNVDVNNGVVTIHNGDWYWNMQGGNKGTRFCSYNVANDPNAKLNLWYHDEITDDPYELNGQSYGLMTWNGGKTAKAMMADENGTTDEQGRSCLEAKFLTVMTKNDDSSTKLYVPNNTADTVSMWMFKWLEDDIYYVKGTDSSGNEKYLSITTNGLSMADSPDDTCRIKVTPASEGVHKGQIFLKSADDTATLTYSNKYAQGFNVGGEAGLEWLYLVEEKPEDILAGYEKVNTATKVSISDTEQVRNGQHVIIYTRQWKNDHYEYYALNGSGELVPCEESGNSIEWVGSNLNDMLWEFTEYTDETTGEPNGYYELKNLYAESNGDPCYLAPKYSAAGTLQGIMSDKTVGLLMEGRRNQQYYSTITAWDNPEYMYSSLLVDLNEADPVVKPCVRKDGLDFYFAIMDTLPVDDEIHTVPTIDNELYGIKMKMIDLSNGPTNDAKGQMNKFLGNTTNNGMTFKHTPGLLSTNLVNGYPTAAGGSLADLFANGDITDANYLFIESTYQATGYYEYNSTQNYAYMKDNGDFIVYKELGTNDTQSKITLKHGQFFPYNRILPGRFAVSNSENLYSAIGQELPDTDPRKHEQLYLVEGTTNYYYAMELEASFIQTPSGLDAWGHDIIFEFSGDDDFWLYVDDELAIDLGGIHSAVPGTVNFRTGMVNVNGTQTTLYDLFYNNYKDRGHTDAEALAYVNSKFTQNSSGQYVFKDNTKHTMRIFYMERGAGASNLHMKFNLAAVKKDTVQLHKEIEGINSSDSSYAVFPYQIFYTMEDSPEEKHMLRNAFAPDSVSVEYSHLFGNPESVNYVYFIGGTQPVPFLPELKVGNATYYNVFMLKPDETAEITFPSLKDALGESYTVDQYRIVECGIDPNVYTQVRVNEETVSGVQNNDNPSVYDYGIGMATTEARPKVNYINKVDSVQPLELVKELYKGFDEVSDPIKIVPYDIDGNPIESSNDPKILDSDLATARKAKFSFRLYLKAPFDEDFTAAGLYTYHIKDPAGYYCKWSPEEENFVRITNEEAGYPNGTKNFEDLTEDYTDENGEVVHRDRFLASFETGPYGTIAGIPAYYTIEVRDFVPGTEYKIVERPSETAEGYQFWQYEKNDAGNNTVIHTDPYDPMDGIAGTIEPDGESQAWVRNYKGYEMVLKKTWGDAPTIEDRDPAYFAVYRVDNDGAPVELVPGSVKELAYKDKPQELHWWYRLLPLENTTLDDYSIFEVTLSGDYTVTDGTVTVDTDNVVPVLDGGLNTINGTLKGQDDQRPIKYTVTYDIEEIPDDVNNVLTVNADNAPAELPPVRFIKHDWNDDPLSGAVFSLVYGEDSTSAFDTETKTSDADGLIGRVYLQENVEYTLTEKAPPQGYIGLDRSLKVRLEATSSGCTLNVNPEIPAGYPVDYEVTKVDGDLTLIVRNRPYELKMIKIDGTDSSVGLPSAVFSLFKQQTIGQDQTWDENHPVFTGLTTDEHGVIPEIDKELPAGTYQLRETQAPSGYKPLDAHVNFTVTQQGEVELGAHPDGVELTTTTDDRTGMRTYTVSIPNHPLPLMLKKTDADGNNLPGAQFQLQMLNSKGSWVYLKDKDGNNLYDPIDMTELYEYELSNLSTGRYKLTETIAPQSYIIRMNEVYFTIAADQTVTLTDAAGTGANPNADASVSPRDSTTGVYTITVINTPGAPLPNTGGRGTRFFTILGSILILGAGVLLWRRRRLI